MKLNNENILYTLFIGTAGMVLLVLMVIVFVIIYQRRIYLKKTQLATLESESQRSLLDAVMITKEAEQKRIAQELHDEIGSSINAVKMSLIQLDLSAETRNKLSSELLDISKNVRRISNELMPSVLDELGFHQAISFLVKKFKESSSISINLNSMLDQPYQLEKQTELSLYRVLQELLNNISKYAKAENIELSISHTANSLTIVLSDDGLGFVPTNEFLSKENSLGLKNIISRLQLIKAESKYELNSPKGTKVTLQLYNK